MNNLSIHDICFDVITLETKHQEDYEQSRSSQEFSENYRENPKDSFADGQWQTDCYRSGYLSGVAKKWDEQFSQLR